MTPGGIAADAKKRRINSNSPNCGWGLTMLRRPAHDAALPIRRIRR